MAEQAGRHRQLRRRRGRHPGHPDAQAGPHHAEDHAGARGGNIPFVAKHLDEDKRLKPTEEMEQSATAMLDELLRWTESLAPLRKK